MRNPQVQTTTPQRKAEPTRPQAAETARSAPQVLDLRQLKQVAGGTSAPVKCW